MKDNMLVSYNIGENELIPVWDDEVNMDKYQRIPFTEIGLLGAGLASLPKSMRTTVQTVKTAIEGLYKADLHGLEGGLVQAKDGTGFLGAVVKQGEGLQGQARFIPVDKVNSTVTTVAPIDPATIAIMVALADINKKLDQIQETQQDIISFLENIKESELIGKYKSLNDMLKEYNSYCNNPNLVKSRLNEVQRIMTDARGMQVLYQKQIDRKTQKKKLLHLNSDAKKYTQDIALELKRYRMAVNLFAMSKYVEVILSQESGKQFLANASNEIVNSSYQYRKMYTKCSEMIERYCGQNIESWMMKGLGAATRFTGKIVEKVPLVSKTQLDENMISTGERMSDYGNRVSEKATLNFKDYSDSGIKIYIDSIDSLRRIYHEPKQLLMDEEAIYMVA